MLKLDQVMYSLLSAGGCELSSLEQLVKIKVVKIDSVKNKFLIKMVLKINI